MTINQLWRVWPMANRQITCDRQMDGQTVVMLGAPGLASEDVGVVCLTALSSRLHPSCRCHWRAFHDMRSSSCTSSSTWCFPLTGCCDLTVGWQSQRRLTHYTHHHHVSTTSWLNYSKIGGGTLHFIPSLTIPSLPYLPFPFLRLPSLFVVTLLSLSLEVGPLNPARGSGSAVSSPIIWCI